MAAGHVSSVIRSYVNHKDQKLERGSMTRQILDLPRFVANHKGGVILADLDHRGDDANLSENVKTFKRFPVLQMAWPTWYDDNPTKRVMRRCMVVVCIAKWAIRWRIARPKCRWRSSDRYRCGQD